MDSDSFLYFLISVLHVRYKHKLKYGEVKSLLSVAKLLDTDSLFES